jgi:hypothetical protein
MKKVPNNIMIGLRVGMDYKWYTYKEVGDMCDHMSLALIDKGYCPVTEGEDGKDFRFLGIMAKNSIEWVTSYMSGWW